MKESTIFIFRISPMYGFFEHTVDRNMFFYDFCLMMEGSGSRSGSVQIMTHRDLGGPKTYESESGSTTLVITWSNISYVVVSSVYHNSCGCLFSKENHKISTLSPGNRTYEFIERKVSPTMKRSCRDSIYFFILFFVILFRSNNFI